MTEPMDFLSVARPRLPTADALIPYLREIDEARWYTNGGSLLKRFETRLADHFAGDSERPAAVAAVSSATMGLVLALLATTGGRGGTCLMPSWTFAATACAVTAAGLTPRFVDVDPDTWLPDRAAVEAELAAGPVTAVVLVVPGGAWPDLDAWHRLTARHRTALVVDAADGFDTVRPGPVAQVVSLHACKAFGVGEGGLVVSADTALVDTVRRLANFGFDGRRTAIASGLNGKMSEYTAAVGHAALDVWPDTRRAWLAVADTYRTLLHRFGLALLFDGDRARSTALVDVGTPLAGAIEAALHAQGVEVRRWWGDGCHRQPAFAAFPSGDLSVTERLASRVLGLPFHPDLGTADAERVVRLLGRTLGIGE